jgi:hypothetical protein
MMYWDEMNSKNGFDDGAAVPQEAWTAREVYVRALNAVAAHKGSKVRAIAWDRPGVHNPCLIMQVPAAFFDKLSPEQVLAKEELKLPREWPEEPGVELVRGEPTDDAWVEAVDECVELPLDDYVVVDVRLDPEFDLAEAALRAGNQLPRREEESAEDGNLPGMPEETDEVCDCEKNLPGTFCSGIPGILARVEKGRVVPGTKVERCDACERYESDEAALQKLIELGIAPADATTGESSN